jgi:hypothetical protein
MIKNFLSSLSWELVTLILATAVLLGCKTTKNLTTNETQEYIIPFVADSSMSHSVVNGRTFYTDSVLIDLRLGSRRYVIAPKTSCKLDTVVTKGYMNGEYLAVKGYTATFSNGKKLFYMVQDGTMMPILTPLFSHPDSVMIDDFFSYNDKEIWRLYSGKGSRLFYDPNETISPLTPAAPPLTTEQATISQQAKVVPAPLVFVTDTIRGIDYKDRLIKPKN